MSEIIKLLFGVAECVSKSLVSTVLATVKVFVKNLGKMAVQIIVGIFEAIKDLILSIFWGDYIATINWNMRPVNAR